MASISYARLFIRCTDEPLGNILSSYTWNSYCCSWTLSCRAAIGDTWQAGQSGDFPVWPKALQSVSVGDVIHLTDWQPLHSTRTLIKCRTFANQWTFQSLTSETEEIACIYCSFIALKQNRTAEDTWLLFHAQPKASETTGGTTDRTLQMACHKCRHCKKNVFSNGVASILHYRANVFVGAPATLLQDH